MKKIFSLLAATLMAGSMMATTVASWNNGTCAAGEFTVTASDASKVSLSYSTKYNANKTACTAMTFTTSITASSGQPTDYYVKATAEGGFKAGDTVRFAPFTVMSESDFIGTKYANIRVYGDNAIVFETSSSATDKSAVTDGHEQAGDVQVREFVLTNDCDSLCFGRTGGTRINVLSFEVVRAGGSDPIVGADSIFYSFEAYGLDTIWTDSLFSNGVHVYSANETDNKNLMMIKEVKRSYDTHSFTKALYFAGSPKGNARYATVALDGPCTVTVYAMSSTNNASTTRSLYLSVGSLSDKTEVIRHTTDGSSQQIQKGTFVYNGTEATDLYFSVDGGFYLFGFEVAKQYFVTTHDDYATFCAPVDVVLPDALTAYAATEISEQWIHLEQMTLTENKLAANTPVVLMSEEDGTYALDMTENAESAIFEGTNLLMGTVARTQNPGNVFCLNSEAAAFQQYTGAYIPANKAYLQDATITAASVRIALGPTVATSVENIESVSVKKIMVNGRIHVVRNGNHYNLEGKVIQ